MTLLFKNTHLLTILACQNALKLTYSNLEFQKIFRRRTSGRIPALWGGVMEKEKWEGERGRKKGKGKGQRREANGRMRRRSSNKNLPLHHWHSTSLAVSIFSSVERSM